MQRLTDLFRGRLSGERGATATVFALLLVPMLGFAAIAVDIGALYAERARLQVAADAAAIAVAQDCSRGNCGDMLATARAMVAANDGDAVGGAAGPRQRPAQRDRHRPHPRAALVRAGPRASTRPRSPRRATVGWGGAQPGHRRHAADLLLVRVRAADRRRPAVGHDVVRTIYFTKTSNTTGCTGPSNNVVPGGFAYLSTDPGKCAATTRLGGQWIVRHRQQRAVGLLDGGLLEVDRPDRPAARCSTSRATAAATPGTASTATPPSS